MQQSDAMDAASTTSRGTHRKRAALTPYRAEIERWVGEGKDDEWIAHALGTTRSSVQSFRSRRGILRRSGSAATADAEEAAQQQEEEKKAASVFEGVLEHGEEQTEGYGLWLDPAVADDPIFKSGFSEVSDVEVTIEEGRIVLTPAHRSGDRNPVPDEAGRQLEALFGGDAGSAADPDLTREQGRVKWFHEEKNYGFICRPSGGGDLFFHGSEIKGVTVLDDGQEVSYEVGRNNRGLIATEVRAAH